MTNGIPKEAKVFQLRPLSKEPANGTGHLGAESQEDFVPTNENVGMVLGNEAESQFLCLDIDYLEDPTAQALLAEAVKAPTMTVETPHGRQVIWNSPKGLPRLRASLGPSVGELLSHGYIVAAGAKVLCSGSKHADGVSCGVKHYVSNGIEPVLAPPWVVALAEELAAKKSYAGESERAERKGIPAGSHDKFGADLAYNLRRWCGLDEEAIQTFFREGGLKGAVSLLEGYQTSHPFTQVDADRWASSAVRATPAIVSASLPIAIESGQDSETTCYASKTYVGEVVRWWIRGFVPQGHLVALYGAGGTGKSTLGSWLFAEVTKRVGACATWSIEESADLFIGRAALGGADRSLMHSVNKPSEWMFPRDTERLRALIRRLDLKFLWFDSLYSHFESDEGMNVSERARKVLGPLEQMCREENCCIMGVFHENKSGAFLGATEMENVVRVLLKAERRTKSSKAPLVIKCWKTNMPYRPDFYMRFEADRKIMADSLTGEVQLEEIQPGLEVPLQVPIARRISDTRQEDEEMENVLEAAANAGTEKKFSRMG
jgi:KaiC/GvpD/RAD55 family RecA-like ATPase